MDASQLPEELIRWFADDTIDPGDAPELHLVDLEIGELEKIFDALKAHGPEWTNRKFWVDDEARDYTVHERPEVASLVAARAVSVACIGADGISIAGTRLPRIDMFLYPDSIQFFWWPGADWRPESVAAFLTLLTDLVCRTIAGELRVDPRYPADSRETLRAALEQAGIPSERLEGV